MPIREGVCVEAGGVLGETNDALYVCILVIISILNPSSIVPYFGPSSRACTIPFCVICSMVDSTCGGSSLE